jgi:tetratricopeptide (TPR) repeat protein
MDLTTLAAALFLAIGLIGADTVLHSGSIVVEVTAAPKMEGEIIDQATLESEFDDQLYEIAKVESVVSPPEIRTSRDQGLGMALAQSVKAEDLAYALQTSVGYAPDRLRLALFLEHGELRGRVSGVTRHIGTFTQALAPHKDEAVLAFVRRCALWSASRVAPYSTALYLMQKHSSDKEFTDVVALIEHAKAELPPTPVSFDRSALDNLLGIVLLFRNDAAAAQEVFDRAVEAYPENPVAEINAAFADLQLNKYEQGADRMRHMTRDLPPKNKVLLASAYMTWAAAEMGLHNLAEADRLLAISTEINPDSSSAFGLWAELKDLRGDHAAAERDRHQAMINTTVFENYGEVATLYFHLSWRDDEPVVLNKFNNPSIVSFH